MKPSIIVTGAAGFIGSHLCEYYIKNNYIVFAIDNFITGSKENIKLLKNENFYFFEKNICDSWSYLDNQIETKIKKNLKYIFHFASPAAVNQYQQYSLETMWANSVGLHNAIVFADNHHAKVIFASTSEVYGSPNITPQNENYWGNVNPFGQRSCYDESKRFGEALIYTSNSKNNTEHSIVRIFNTYGPRMNINDGRVVLQFIRQALKNKDITIYGSGRQTRSFCYIDDLLTGIAAFAESNKSKGPLNLGSSDEISVLALAKLIIDLTGSKSSLTYHPQLSDDPVQRCPDLQLAKVILNYTPKTPLIVGLQKIIQEVKATHTL